MCIFCTPDGGATDDRLTDDEIRAVENCPNLADRVPTTIVTGFLGAGKTTLLNWLLRGTHGKRICVLQNEFGSVPVDDALIVRNEKFAEVAVVTMPTGCMCCKVRGDLVDGLKSLARGVVAAGGGHFDAVIVETSGLSEVGPVAQTFFADRFVMRNFSLDAVVAVVDAQAAPAAIELARFADGDSDDGSGSSSSSSDSDGSDSDGGADAGSGRAARRAPLDEDERLRRQAAKLLCEQLCLADVVLLNKLDLVSAAEAAEASSLVGAINPTAKLLRCEHGQVEPSELLGISAFSVNRALAVDDLFLAQPEPPDAGSAPFAFLNPPRRVLPGPSQSAGHLHDLFGSVGLEAEGQLDELDFNDWLEGVFAKFGRRLYRAKGLIFFKGKVEPSAVQCVGAHIESDKLAPELLEPSVVAAQRSRMVFIGRTRGIERELAKGFGVSYGGECD